MLPLDLGYIYQGHEGMYAKYDKEHVLIRVWIPTINVQDS